MNSLDKKDPDFGTCSAHLLKELKDSGIQTSVDLVSENGNRYSQVVIPALAYTDYLIINELEAEKTSGINITDSQGNVLFDEVPKALKRIKSFGVSKWVIIHAPCGCWGLDENGEVLYEPSRKLPKGFVKGTVGAGDAFCAGALWAAYNQKSIDEALICGNASAIQSLRSPTATGTLMPINKALDQYNSFEPCEF